VKKICNNCGCYNNIIPQDVHIGENPFVLCEFCMDIITISNEYQSENTFIKEQIPLLNIGTVIIVDNKEHPLHNQIGIIKSKKHKHYRVELDNQLIWMPQHWIKQHEPKEND